MEMNVSYSRLEMDFVVNEAAIGTLSESVDRKAVVYYTMPLISHKMHHRTFRAVPLSLSYSAKSLIPRTAASDSYIRLVVPGNVSSI